MKSPPVSPSRSPDKKGEKSNILSNKDGAEPSYYEEESEYDEEEEYESEEDEEK